MWKGAEWWERGKAGLGLSDYLSFFFQMKMKLLELKSTIFLPQKKTVKIYFCCKAIKGEIALNIRK